MTDEQTLTPDPDVNSFHNESPAHPQTPSDPEHTRLVAAQAGHEPWSRWGPYLSERQWGTVREDYSANGDAWNYLSHDQARSRAYRWGEDGLLGISDEHGQLCLALSLWNEADTILKERLFGLTNGEGNHGEDVKEYYYFLDSTPTHSWMKALYKYPQAAYPYEELIAQNATRTRNDPEYELFDTGIFADDRYFDIVVEYAKAAPDDIYLRISATNHAAPDDPVQEAAPLHLLPTLWFRNTWSWGEDERRPGLRAEEAGTPPNMRIVHATHPDLGGYWLSFEGTPDLLFTENESNTERLWQTPNRSPYVKDAFHRAIIHGEVDAVNPALVGTKAAAHYQVSIAPGATETIYLRLSSAQPSELPSAAAELFVQREHEADRFYAEVGARLQSQDDPVQSDARLVHRQALAGLLWSKQYYNYDVRVWLQGDPNEPAPSPERWHIRNEDWLTANNDNVLLMPDTWEYPWYASWDLAFHCVSMALVDAGFAKRQLILLLREWYMHPNGQLPAYEWNFSNTNPPVHAWAALRVYQIEWRLTGSGDRVFLERVFLKLLLNFTWWVNREDPDGHNIFQGGFLGLDNIGVFDRSQPLPTGGYLEQADGTAWMGMYSLSMLAIALELARDNQAYEDVATKFFEHFMYIAGALNDLGGQGLSLWDEQDEFFYDVIRLPDGQFLPLRVRSLVGLVPLLAVLTISADLLDKLPHFKARLEWFLTNRPDLAGLVSRWDEPGKGEERLLALVRGHRMKALLARMLDPNEFLSDFGVRSLSKYHAEHPYQFHSDGQDFTVTYEPAESRSGLFGGNSNWRGPIWFPMNYLLIEALQRYHHYYGDDFQVEYPTGSGETHTLWEIAEGLSRRLTHMFLRGPDGRRAVFGRNDVMQTDPRWCDYLLFNEYFDGDTGAGLGANHQTGWTALVAKLLDQTGGQ